ncbi:unnamed protein product, partial [Rotaria socialis]
MDQIEPTLRLIEELPAMRMHVTISYRENICLTFCAYIFKFNYCGYRPTLTKLYVGENQISDNGAQLFAEVLKTNKTLTVLDLEKNTITDNGAHQLAEALKTNKVLTVLGLNGNQITDDGAQKLADALKTNQ